MSFDSILTREKLGIPGVQESVAIRRRITEQKYTEVLPRIMQKHEIDLWLILDREFNPDPMLVDLGGDTGGVRTAHIFFSRGSAGVEKVVINSHGFRERIILDLFDEIIFYGYQPEGLAPYLKEAIEKRDPYRIGINCSPTLPMADGLTYELRKYLEEAIGPKYAARLVSAELLSRDYRTTRVSSEVELYRTLTSWNVAWMETALSEHVIEVGKTTPLDVYWWMREVAQDLGLGPSLLPGVRLSRKGHNFPENSDEEIVQPGDYLQIDAGVSFLNYHNDMKRMAYVLRDGEMAPPAPLQKAYADGIKMRDLITSNMRPGAVGTQVWQAVADRAVAQGYEILHPTGGHMRNIGEKSGFGNYSHSIGNNTHGIGARISENWPVAFGDRVGYAMTLGDWYSIELHVATSVPEWDNRTVEVHIEEQCRLTGDSEVEYFVTPQSAFLLIPRQQ